MEQFVKYLVQNLAQKPEDVKVVSTEEGHGYYNCNS